MAEYILAHLRDWVPADQHQLITPDTSLTELDCDALVPVELALLIELHTGCDMIPDPMIMRWQTVGDVLNAARQAATSGRLAA